MSRDVFYIEDYNIDYEQFPEDLKFLGFTYCDSVKEDVPKYKFYYYSRNGASVFFDFRTNSHFTKNFMLILD